MSELHLMLSTRNEDKRRELGEMISEDIILHHPQEFFDEDIEETGSTLWDNALLKARYGFEKSGIPTIADDTGLEVDFLDDAPGVYSSRYAGEYASYDDNVRKLLGALDGVESKFRKARFRTVIAFVHPGAARRFDGVLEGQILTERRGVSGFGYDPVFQPEGYDKTLAEMTLHEKNVISHRGRAFRAFSTWLESNRDVIFGK